MGLLVVRSGQPAERAPSAHTGRFLRKNRDDMMGRPVHEQLRRAAQMVTPAAARHAFASSGL